MTSIPWDELMDAAGDSDFAPIPQGDYDMKVVATEATKSSTDKPMWKVTLEVEGGPHAGKKAWTQQTLTTDNANALNIFFRQMAAAGLTQDFFRTKPNPQQIADALLGRRIRAKLIIEEYQGVPRNKVKAWNPPGMSAGSPPPPSAGAPSSVTPPPAASTPPPVASSPPPVASSPPPAASTPATPPPAASTPPPAATPPPATPPPAEEPATAPAAATPPPAEPAAEPAPVTASGAPPAGGAQDWVVEPRQTGSTEPPPF